MKGGFNVVGDDSKRTKKGCKPVILIATEGLSEEEIDEVVMAAAARFQAALEKMKGEKKNEPDTK
jgi:hypothetical protein